MGAISIYPATYLRKDFTLRKSPQRAVLYVTSQGIVEPRLNGKKVGDDFLVPGWTDYHKRIYYRSYDVTSQVRQGDNTLGAILGDGWFRGHLSIIGQNLYGRQTRLLAQLHVFYADGSSEIVASDGTWTAGFGPILAADLYAGETYDARLGTRRLGPTGLCQSRVAAGAGWRAIEPARPSGAGSARPTYRRDPSGGDHPAEARPACR